MGSVSGIIKGQRVFGVDETSGIPPEGAIVDSVTWKNGTWHVYIVSLKGDAIGTRYPDQIRKVSSDERTKDG